MRHRTTTPTLILQLLPNSRTVSPKSSVGERSPGRVTEAMNLHPHTSPLCRCHAFPPFHSLVAACIPTRKSPAIQLDRSFINNFDRSTSHTPLLSLHPKLPLPLLLLINNQKRDKTTNLLPLSRKKKLGRNHIPNDLYTHSTFLYTSFFSPSIFFCVIQDVC